MTQWVADQAAPFYNFVQLPSTCFFFYSDGKVRTWQGKEKTTRVLFVPSISRCFIIMNVYQLAQLSTLWHCVFFFFNLMLKSSPTN